MAKAKYMRKDEKEYYNLSQYPNFSATGNVWGMKHKYYGKDALLVRSGAWIYHVPQEIYDAAH